jgi:hypothetical protein
VLASSGICPGAASGVGRGISVAAGESVGIAIGRDDVELASGKYVKLRVGGSDHFSVPGGTLVAWV